jgi:hypothetical protein
MGAMKRWPTVLAWLLVALAGMPAWSQPPLGVPSGEVRGQVLEADRPQPGLEVVLRTELGMPVANMITAPDGTFLFRDVAPGVYLLTAGKPVSTGFTTGAARVTVGPAKIDSATIYLLHEPRRP